MRYLPGWAVGSLGTAAIVAAFFAGGAVGASSSASLSAAAASPALTEPATAAGFVLQEESDVLRNPADDRSERVFESDIRGHTDQFALRFVKPAN